ncbi:WAT1-related protein At3g28050-like [Rhododendron vialii]|uniref:WAT1-related protein At3g28050-like n=1 Tax=Rhododendron vialii TaxID=182163 RepID=UPI00265EA28D|nr:WAT1-related protein At3g28050-like [Rhododendron vialii]
MKEYPAELTVVFFYNLCVSVLAAIVGIFAKSNASAWRVKADIGLVSILCSGIFGSFLDNAVNTWVLKVKGPLYVAMFKPLSIVIAVVMGMLFLGDTLYLGSIVGATITSVGFYNLMWRKAKEDVDESGEIGYRESVADKLKLHWIVSQNQMDCPCSGHSTGCKEENMLHNGFAP